MTARKTFPVMGTVRGIDAVTGFPWCFIAELCRKQLTENREGQSLEAIADTGGASWIDLYYALQGRSTKGVVETPFESTARGYVMDTFAMWQKTRGYVDQELSTIIRYEQDGEAGFPTICGIPIDPYGALATMFPKNATAEELLMCALGDETFAFGKLNGSDIIRNAEARREWALRAYALRTLALLLQADVAKKDMGDLAPIKQLIRDHHLALDKREDGIVSADRTLFAIKQLLGMEWKPGVEKKRRAEAENKVEYPPDYNEYLTDCYDETKGETNKSYQDWKSGKAS